MKKILFAVFSVTLIIILFASNPQSAKAYSNNSLIDDAVFDNAASMDTAAIQAFLNQFPNSCIKNPNNLYAYPNSYSSYGAGVSAATVIRRAADLWGLNPRVILTKLEQEESLVRGNAGCEGWRYNSAMGYGCPDSTGCNPAYAGFSQQVTKGSFQLKFNKEVAVGNGDWQGNGDLNYGGYMTQGTRKRCNTCTAVYYDGFATIDGVLVHMDTGATASLYSYTPHVPSSFPVLFETFFGAGSTSAGSAYPAGSIFRSYFPKSGEHFYTQSYTEWQNTARSGATAEGIAFFEPASATATPVYRLLIPNGKHFYTASVVERDVLVGTNRYRYEGVAFYAEPNQITGYAPVWRLRNDQNGDHFYTVSIAERDAVLRSPAWKLDGPGWYGY